MAANPTTPRAESTPMDPARWLDDHGEALYRYALGRVGNPDDAADLVQETLLAAFQARDRFEGRSALRTWLVGILVRRIGQFRRERARGARPVELGPEIEDTTFTRNGKWQQCPKRWTPPVGAASEHDEALGQALQQCIDALPERAADAFLLREQFELDGDATSQVMDVSPGHLSTILHRARLALRSCMERRSRGDRP